MSKLINLLSSLEEQKRGVKRSTKRSEKKSTEKVQRFTAAYNGLTREEKNQIENYYNDIKSNEGIQTFTPGDGLTQSMMRRLLFCSLQFIKKRNLGIKEIGTVLAGVLGLAVLWRSFRK